MDLQTDELLERALNAKATGTPSGKPRAFLLIGTAVTIAAVLSGILLWQTHNAVRAPQKNTGPDRAALTVKASAVAIRPVQKSLLVSGGVWAWDPVQIGSEINGLRVTDIYVDEGAYVKSGQVLARLNNSVLTAQASRQKARLEGAEAALVKALQPNRPEDLSALEAAYAQAKAQVAQEEASLERAQATLAESAANARRYQDLVRQGAVSAEDFDKRLTLSKVAHAEVTNAQQKVSAAKFNAEQAHQRLSMGLRGGRREDIDISRSQVAEIRANYQELLSQLRQTEIKAPAAGLISRRMVHIGDIASSTKPMFDLVRDGRMELRAQVPENDLPSIAVGQPVQVLASKVDDFKGDSTVKGVVREISPAIDEDTRLGLVRIDLDLPRDRIGLLRPGNFVKGELNLGLRNAPTVPSQAVVFRDNRALVYILDKGADNQRKVHMRYVKIGSRSRVDGAVEVLSGLNPGDLVVQSGAGFLKEGDLVRVVD